MTSRGRVVIAETSCLEVRLALSPTEAADMLGVSRDFFDEHVLPELRVVRRGRRRLVAVRELERWLDVEAAPLLREELS